MRSRNIMFNHSSGGVAALLFTIVALGGCQAAEDERVCAQPGVLNLTCLVYTDETPQPANSSPPSVPPPPSGGNPTADINAISEYEPNSSLNNANPVSFPAATASSLAGINIVGSVHQDDDTADFFIFTPERSGLYGVYLCGATCIEFLDTDAVYLSVYDQSQTTIAGTPIGTSSEQEVAVDLTAGLAYYVEVHAMATGMSAFDYRLVVIE